MKVAVVLFATVALVLAEPPVPSSQYLPSNQYVPPSNQYGPPGQTAAIIRPNSQYGAPNGLYGAPRNGNGNGGYDDQSEPASYNFEYHVEDAPSGNDFGHQESREGDVAQGKYFVLLPDGRRQVVEYVADNEGYKPKISYEQVGNGNGYGNGGYPRNGNGNGNGGYSGNGNGNGNGGYQY